MRSFILLSRTKIETVATKNETVYFTWPTVLGCGGVAFSICSRARSTLMARRNQRANGREEENVVPSHERIGNCRPSRKKSGIMSSGAFA
jgi:hypothetical protein